MGAAETQTAGMHLRVECINYYDKKTKLKKLNSVVLEGMEWGLYAVTHVTLVAYVIFIFEGDIPVACHMWKT